MTINRIKLWIITIGLSIGLPAYGQTVASSAPEKTVTQDLPTIEVISTTPLPGTGVDVDKVPSDIVSIDSKQIESSKTGNIAETLSQQSPGVSINASSGNDFQPNVAFRGFVASPVSGTPQGLAVYQNGMRINEAFGDTVNWDLIPTTAVRSMSLISNNPAFGLNALGGAISIQMKDGFVKHNTSLDFMVGSNGRVQSSIESGKQVGRYAFYGILEDIHDGGYRNNSASDLRRFYGDIGYRGETGDLHLNMAYANNSLGATGPAPIELLNQSWSNVYTTPQTSSNEAGFLNLTGKFDVNPKWTLQGNAYIRTFYQKTVDGNTSSVAPCDADATLLCLSDGTTAANGSSGSQLSNTFGTSTIGEIDRTNSHSMMIGTAFQGTNTDQLFGHDNHFVIGSSLDYGMTDYNASAELGTIGTDFSITGSGTYLGSSSFLGPVSLKTADIYGGLYGLETFDLSNRLSLTFGGRLNIANIALDDQLGTSLDGNATYVRLNPVLGATYKLTNALTAYAGYSEANRAPTALELGCADSSNPCMLANFLVSDPALKQVVSRTFEAGLRGAHDFGEDNGRLNWHMGAFTTTNQDDILNIPSSVAGYGYFTNVGNTRRQGLEAQVTLKSPDLTLYGNYTFMDASFLDALTLSSNSPAADINGYIYVTSGDRIPMIPPHRVTLGAEYAYAHDIKLTAEIVAVSSQYMAGDASNQESQLNPYAVVNLGASYDYNNSIQFYTKIDNVLNNHYYNYGTFFETSAIPSGGFTDSRSLSPAQPLSIFFGIKAKL